MEFSRKLVTHYDENGHTIGQSLMSNGVATHYAYVSNGTCTIVGRTIFGSTVTMHYSYGPSSSGSTLAGLSVGKPSPLTSFKICYDRQRFKRNSV